MDQLIGLSFVVTTILMAMMSGQLTLFVGAIMLGVAMKGLTTHKMGNIAQNIYRFNRRQQLQRLKGKHVSADTRRDVRENIKTLKENLSKELEGNGRVGTIFGLGTFANPIVGLSLPAFALYWANEKSKHISENNEETNPWQKLQELLAHDATAS